MGKLQKMRLSKFSHRKNKCKFTHVNTPKQKKQKRANISNINVNNQDNAAEDYSDDILDMIEEDDMVFLKNAAAHRSYKYHIGSLSNGNMPMMPDGDVLEREYEAQKKKETVIKNKLPIKTSKGFVYAPEEEDESGAAMQHSEDEVMDHEDSHEDVEEEMRSATEPLAATHLLNMQNKMLEAKKIQIGSLSSSVLENPNEKINNLKILLNLLEDTEEVECLSVKKIVIISLVEVFKDLLPAYTIKQVINKNVKLKKDTLRLEKFEISLLQYYKKYLQILERLLLQLRKKQGYASSEVKKKLGVLALNSLCDLLHVHPYFNYAENIVQTVVPFLNHSDCGIRQKVSVTCKGIFREDKKGEITLTVLRLLNQHVKKCSCNVHPDMLEVLLCLKINNINLDEEKECKLKQKKLMSHKSNVQQLSKMERKRKSQIHKLEKELLEAKAEENKQAARKCETEILKVAFQIFFRVLKNSKNTKIVGICLQGIARFASSINIDFYVDLINILDSLLKTEWLDYREQLYCIKTVFVILSQQGEVLNLDPVRFYNSMYENLLTVNASRNHDNIMLVLEILMLSLIKRHKKISAKRMASFMKRTTTLSLQLLHNGAIGCLAIIKSLLQLHKALDVLLDLESSFESGQYVAEMNDAEYSNASSSVLYELILLNQHYHPTVIEYAKYVAKGVPNVAEMKLCNEFARSSADQLCNDFDMSTMCFSPSIPVPKKSERKNMLKSHQFCDSSFKQEYIQLIRNNGK